MIKLWISFLFLQATVLGVLAENSLPMTMAPVMINTAKALAKDKPALDMISMDRTTASYKMTYGLGASFLEKTVMEMRTSPFSLNIDESTSKGLKRVLAVLVSYYSHEEDAVLVEHLASLELVKVNSESLYEALVDLFNKHEIPWGNCVSILMDSCNVMRGSKSGLETRIRDNKANHLLDVDGDSCHHIHNAAKKFSAPFGGHLESLFTDLYNDMKWSTDIRDYFEQVCELCGIKFTMPERFISHRWLSAYDVAIDTERLFKAYQVFYFAFLPKSLKKDYVEVILEACKSLQISIESSKRIREIRTDLASKKFTEDGRNRKQRIVEKLFYQERKTKLQLSFYIAVLPLLKAYVCLFQGKDTLIHLLHEKQVQLFTDFLGCFVKPEHLVGKTGKELKALDLESDDEKYMKQKDMFVGGGAEKLIKTLGKEDSDVSKFRNQASAAYIECGKHLQRKLPLNNSLLKCVACTDPAVRGHIESSNGLKRLSHHLNHFLSEKEQSDIILEITKFQVDNKLPEYSAESDFVSWWTGVFKTNRYPAMNKLMTAVMSMFHGPQVESSFNLMGDVVDIRSTRMNTETLSAIQTTKYAFKARNTTALQYFSRADVRKDPVKKSVCICLRRAASRHKKEQERKRHLKEIRKEKLNVSSVNSVPVSKSLSKSIVKDRVESSLLKHQKKARKRALEALAEKARKKKKCF